MPISSTIFCIFNLYYFAEISFNWSFQASCTLAHSDFISLNHVVFNDLNDSNSSRTNSVFLEIVEINVLISLAFLFNNLIVEVNFSLKSFGIWNFFSNLAIVSSIVFSKSEFSLLNFDNSAIPFWIFWFSSANFLSSSALISANSFDQAFLTSSHSDTIFSSHEVLNSLNDSSSDKTKSFLIVFTVAKVLTSTDFLFNNSIVEINCFLNFSSIWNFFPSNLVIVNAIVSAKLWIFSLNFNNSLAPSLIFWFSSAIFLFAWSTFCCSLFAFSTAAESLEIIAG